MSRFSMLMRAAGLPLFVLMLVFAAGCSEDDITPPAPPTDVELITILCNPLAPAPGATAIFTAQLSGDGGAADFEWTASEGTFLTNGSIIAEWRAPTTAGAYEIRVVARIGTAVDTLSKYVLVRNFEAVSTGIRFSWYPHLVGGELYFVGSNLTTDNNAFYGYHVYRKSVSPVLITTNISPTIAGGEDFIFGSTSVFTSVATNAMEYLTQQSMNVISFSLVGGANWYVSDNDLNGQVFRKNQHVHPWPSSDLTMAVWQVDVPGIENDGSLDRININFRNGLAPVQRLTASVDSIYFNGLWEFSYYHNIKPIFTPNLDKIVYFVDSTGTFEPCFIPLSGGSPQLGGRRALMIDSSHGIFYYMGIKITENTVFQWNPVAANQLFFVDGESKLCLFDVEAESVEILADKVSEFAISSTGFIAAVAEEGLYVGSLGGEPTLIYARERSNDDIFGVTWSPGSSDQKIAFRMVRKGATSIESFSTMILYVFADERWYHATPRIPFNSEPDLNDYRWRRAVFEESGGGIIMPVATTADGGSVKLYRSY